MKTGILKGLLLIVSVGMMSGFFCQTVHGNAPVNPDIREDSGYVDVPYDIHSIREGMRTVDILGIEPNTDIPDQYDARKHGQVTGVENQKPWNNCWSFATMAALEGSVLSRDPERKCNLSEYHLCFYNFRSSEDPLGGTRGDSVKYDGSFSEFLNSGGNVLVAYHALTNWMGAVPQEATGYSEVGEELPGGTETAYLQDEIHLKQMYQISKSDTEAVKQSIMEYGAVTAALFFQTKYMKEETHAYYNNNNSNANHGVAIVGWDDHFSRNEFSVKPAGDGAWLVKNSWGTSFGQDGYMWVSYYDKSLQDAMCVLAGEEAGRLDHNYQYDGSYYNQYIKSGKQVKAANVFRVPEGATEEILEEVSFEIGNTNVEYSIQIYKNLKDSGNPESGDALMDEPLTGTAVFQGFHTVRLEKPVSLSPGELFAVVVELKSEGNIRVTMEKSQLWNRTYYVAGAEENQSFLCFAGGEWFDAGIRYEGNIRIKAFTTDAEREEPHKMNFRDVNEEGWQYPYVGFVFDRGIMVGKSEEFFGVDQEILRCEFVTTLHNLSEKPIPSHQKSFLDVAEGSWYEDPVLWAAESGLAVGYGNGQFGVSDRITREQLIKILYEYYLSFCQGERSHGKIEGFTDTGRISVWAYEAMCWAVDQGLIVGKKITENETVVAPRDFATRGECAAILSKFLQTCVQRPLCDL